MIEMQLAFQRRHRALYAIPPLADPAGYADRFEGGGIAEIERIGINEILRVGNFAAECDGIARSIRVETRAGFLDLRGNGKIAYAVRRFRQLPHDPVGAFESLMDVPQRTGRAETGKLQPYFIFITNIFMNSFCIYTGTGTLL